jgi:hypothetical protein
MKGKLKLQKKDEDNTPKNVEGSGWGDDSWGQPQSEWNDGGWEDLNQSPSPADLPKRKADEFKALSKGPPKLNDIDLFAMDIKTSSAPKVEAEEVDFFADMQPDFKPKGDSLLSILKGDIPSVKKTQPRTPTTKHKNAAFSFEVKDMPAVRIKCSTIP